MNTGQSALPLSELPPIDWSRWNSWRVSASLMTQSAREPFLQSSNYGNHFEDLVPGIKKVTNKVPVQIEPGVAALFVATQQRLWDVMAWLSLQYCAGAPVEQIREVWPYAMRWAEEYAMFHEAHHRDPNNLGGIVPHAALRTEDYWIVALRLLCFGLLTGYGAQMPRLMKFLDYGNELMGVRDGLIERLVAPFVPGRGEPPDKAARHLPYRKLFKVFAAQPSKRPDLMTTYLDEWYEASRREPYFDRHEYHDFIGYWSWEAAAVSWLLDIDDKSYRNHRFYPADIADYARRVAPRGDSPQPTTRLRCEAGHPCPQEGFWFTPAKPGSRRRFAAGETMPAFTSDYGQTIWQWDDDQSA